MKTFFFCVCVRLICSWWDYLEITNDDNVPFGVFCGERTGKAVLVTGNYAVITFYSDDLNVERGFLITFRDVSIKHSKYS